MQAYIRDALGADVPAIISILQSTASADHESPESCRAALADIEREPGNYLLVAEYDRQIIAVLQLVMFRRLSARRAAQIPLLAVDREFVTSGVDAMLIDHAAERAADFGCEQLIATATNGAVGEPSAWERTGFAELQHGYVRALADTPGYGHRRPRTDAVHS